MFGMQHRRGGKMLTQYFTISFGKGGKVNPVLIKFPPKSFFYVFLDAL